MKKYLIIPIGHKFRFSKKITQFTLALSLLLLSQTCNASLFDDFLDWLSPIWSTNSVEVLEPVEATAGLTFELVDMDGVVYNQDNTSGKYLIINFWATWCPPCLKEIPAFVNFYNQHSAKVEILGLNYEGMDIEAVNSFKKRFNVNYPIILFAGSNEQEYSKFGNLVGMPTTLIYNPDGELLHTFIGEIGIEELAQFIPLES
jgi:thiol-disulfide isomerase/thioredoxin